LLADANLTFTRVLKYIPIIRLGPYPDLSKQWFINIAPTMIKTMIIKALFDYILIMMQFAAKTFFRAKD
jgi:hypothetical protein